MSSDLISLYRLALQDDLSSRFVDNEIKVSAGRVAQMQNSTPVKTSTVIFTTWNEHFDLGQHNAPRRQLVVVIIGSLVVTDSHGKSITFDAGKLLLVEDTKGAGHHTIGRPDEQGRPCLLLQIGVEDVSQLKLG